jgi:hypothetical protein
VPEMDVKTFSTGRFSDFLTLDDLKEEKFNSEDQISQTKKKEVSFRTSKSNANKSLFGSLKNRIGVSLTNIIRNFPAGVLIEKNSNTRSSDFTIESIVYDINLDTTQFNVDFGRLFNPFDILFIKPNSQVDPNTTNKVRNFYSSFTKYVLELSGVTYDIINYTQPNADFKFSLKVKGKPFGSSLNYTENVLIRPNGGLVEEFFSGLDELEQSLLDAISSLENNLITLDTLFPTAKTDNILPSLYNGYQIDIIKEEVADEGITLLRRRVIVADQRGITVYEGTPTFATDDQVLIKEGQFQVDKLGNTGTSDEGNSAPANQSIINEMNELGFNSNNVIVTPNDID